MSKSKNQLQAEIRYAIRLCQRQARLYRRIQAFGVFLSVIGGSATFSILSNSLPHALSYVGAGLLAVSGAALIAIRPADKAVANESDIKRYQDLLAKLNTFDEASLEAAIEEARKSDAPEIDALRNVAYNDVLLEINRADQLIHLNFGEKVIGFLA